MQGAELKSIKEIEQLSSDERIQYYQHVKDYCIAQIPLKSFSTIKRKLAYIISKFMRKYELEIRGTENVPVDDSVIYVCNHSNSHDFFTLTETFVKTNKKVMPLAAEDGLNWISQIMFSLCNSIFINRNDKKTKKAGELSLCKGLLNGISTIIFAESTWNLHPTKAMLPIKAGPVEIALITGKKIVPTIFEYIEVDHECKKESELYSKCVVSFGEPITVNYSDSIFKQADAIQGKMEEMRHLIWEEFGVKKAIDDIDRDLYMNHLFLKKKSMAGYSYDSKYEASFIRRVNGVCENEFYIDEENRFVPVKIE